MKKFFYLLLKIFLYLILLAILALGCYALIVWRDWPAWVGAAIFGGVVGLVLTFFFLKKWFFRRREEKFVKRIIEQDEEAIASAPAFERQRLKDLQDRWRDAVEMLRRSHLRRRGDPLYVLPWFMILGESGSGKSTAVARARLTSILTDVGPTQGVSVTRNCDWWFFEEAVILDTAGRYAIPVDEGRDKEEWERFLALMAKYRRKEPLNGLIVTLGADKLVAGEEDVLTEYGKSIRRRVDELMRVLGARFPVYVLVTKLDQVPGLMGFCKQLPDKDAGQAMGWLNVDLREDAEEIAESTMKSVAERLKDIRLKMMELSGEINPGLIVFPDELESLKPGLKSFLVGAFHENPYQETPMLRGVFFASGRQSGSPHSRILDGLESLQGRDQALPDTNKGLFLSDFFSLILPKDRNLFSPILEYLKWRMVTKNLGLASWLFLTFCFVGLLSLSYVNNMRALDVVTKEFPQPPALEGSAEQNIITMSLFKQKIAQMIQINSNWWAPRLGLTNSLDIQGRLLDLYVRLFRSKVLGPLDKALGASMAGLSSDISEVEMADYIEHVVWRIDLIKERQGGSGLAALDAFPKTSGSVLAREENGVSPEVGAYFSNLYTAYLAWNTDQAALTEELLTLRLWLKRLMALKGSELHWLVKWANSNPNLNAVTLSEFWGGLAGGSAGLVQTDPAFTVEGDKAIKAFIKAVEMAVEDKQDFKEKTKRFWTWYGQQYYSAWRDFASRFNEGEALLGGMADWRAAAVSMSTLSSPYMLLLQRMNHEMAPAFKVAKAPDWARQIRSFEKVAAAQETGGNQTSLLKRAKINVEFTVRKVVGQIDPTDMGQMENIVKAHKEFGDYLKALGDIIPATGSPEEAYKYSTTYLPGGKQDPGGGAKSPFASANAALIKIKNLMVGVQEQKKGDDVFFNIIGGPFKFLVYYVTMESACELQDLWESEVLAKVGHMPAQKMRDALFGQQGLVDKFIAGPARSFIVSSLDGYYARNWYGVSFPFTRPFFTFLQQGSAQGQEMLPQYTVAVKTLPTSVNPGAQQEPYATVLQLDCGEGAQTLYNYNFPETLQFVWKPDTCGDISLSIKFKGLVLTKKYQGLYGFPNFLKDFREGKRTYTPSDFPQAATLLETMGVKKMTVTYAFDGAVPLIKLLEVRPVNTPEQIVECWRQ
ncbi:MAG: type secretion system protein ImpL [Desulfovibrionales bacterium]|nr:type secretion system protein ImpL [Desulfovibrionales bacterium]